MYKEVKQSQTSRRRALLDQMENGQGQGFDCAHCNAICCTSASNSMQITPLEAADIFFYLCEQGRWNPSLKLELETNIKDFRLDKEIQLKRGQYLRKNYTCPFLGEAPLACTLPNTIRPYGCLGFNPHAAGQTEGGNCFSDQNALEARESYELNSEPLTQIKKQILVSWKKLTIPQAVLAIARILE